MRDHGPMTNESDDYFIDVLQQVKGIPRRQECKKPKVGRLDGKENRDPREKEAVNIFETLSLEEPKGPLDSQSPSVSVLTEPKAKNVATSKPVYDMMMRFCFLPFRFSKTSKSFAN